MRSIAETGKDFPLAHTAVAALVLVGQCCAIALQLLPVPASCGYDCGSDILHAGGRSPDQASRWLSVQPLPILKGFTKSFFFLTWFSTIVDYTENYFPIMCHPFLQCRRRLRLEIRKERIIFRRCPSLNSGALAVPRQPKNSGAATAEMAENRCFCQ